MFETTVRNSKNSLHRFKLNLHFQDCNPEALYFFSISFQSFNKKFGHFAKPHLRYTKGETGDPRQIHHNFRPPGSPRAVGQRVTNGLMAINCCGHQHVRAQIRAQRLSIFNDFAEEEAAVEAVSYVPGQLGQHAEEGSDQICDTQMEDKEIHPGEFLATGVSVGELRQGLIGIGRGFIPSAGP